MLELVLELGELVTILPVCVLTLEFTKSLELVANEQPVKVDKANKLTIFLECIFNNY